MLTTLGVWAQKSKVLKHTKKSITFVEKQPSVQY